MTEFTAIEILQALTNKHTVELESGMELSMLSERLVLLEVQDQHEGTITGHIMNKEDITSVITYLEKAKKLIEKHENLTKK